MNSKNILYNHLWDGLATESFKREESYVDFALDQIFIPRCNCTNEFMQIEQSYKNLMGK